MIPICHRINSIEDLKKINQSFGCEVDLRSYKNKIYVSHDPLEKKLLLFENYINFFKHKYLIINVKEEGIITAITKILHKYKIKNYLFLGETLPAILLLKKRHLIDKIIFKVSDIEGLEIIKNLKNNGIILKWVWYENFKKNKISLKALKLFKEYNLKYILCSPELTISNPFSKDIVISNYLKFFKKNSIYIPDLICTKNPSFWIRELSI